MNNKSIHDLNYQLVKLIGKEPKEQPDPNRDEPHQYFLMLQDINPKVKIDIKDLVDRPETGLKELKKIKWSSQ